MPKKKGRKTTKANHAHEPTAEAAAGTSMPWPQHLLDNTIFVDGSPQSLGRRDSSGEGGEGVEEEGEEGQAEPAAAIGKNKKGFSEVKTAETTQTSLFSVGPGRWWGKSGN